MAKVIIKINVAYPQHFTTTLSSQESARIAKGEKEYSSGVEDGSTNTIYVISTWTSVTLAKQFWTSNEAKNQIGQWNPAIPPTFTYIKEQNDNP